jgi:predicted outer membrane protein
MEQVAQRAAFALAAALLAVAGCRETATSAPGGDMNPADLEFVTEAYNIIVFDREEASLAPTYAVTPAVKAIAAHLLNDANAFAAKGIPIMKARGIKPPADLRTDLRIRLYHLRLNQGGLDFDRSFIDDQIASHTEVLARRELLIGTPGQNPQIVALAEDGIKEIRENLAALRAVQRQLPPPPATRPPFGLPPFHAK